MMNESQTDLTNDAKVDLGGALADVLAESEVPRVARYDGRLEEAVDRTVNDFTAERRASTAPEPPKPPKPGA